MAQGFKAGLIEDTRYYARRRIARWLFALPLSALIVLDLFGEGLRGWGILAFVVLLLAMSYLFWSARRLAGRATVAVEGLRLRVQRIGQEAQVLTITDPASIQTPPQDVHPFPDGWRSLWRDLGLRREPPLSLSCQTDAGPRRLDLHFTSHYQWEQFQSWRSQTQASKKEAHLAA